MAAGLSPAATMPYASPKRRTEWLPRQDPTVYRKESRPVGEADRPMRGNHLGFLSCKDNGFAEVGVAGLEGRLGDPVLPADRIVHEHPVRADADDGVHVRRVDGADPRDPLPVEAQVVAPGMPGPVPRRERDDRMAGDHPRVDG